MSATRTEELERTIEIPGDVSVHVDGRCVLVEGPLGKLEEDLSHLPVSFKLSEGKLRATTRWPRKREVGMLGTAVAHVRNMIKGVTRGYRYDLKAVYAHFPVTLKVDGKTERFRIENFTGEKTPRFARIVKGAQVEVKGEDVSVQGTDLKAVSQTAANIQNSTRIRQKDQRVFLDGIYVSHKGAMQVEGKQGKAR